MQGEINLRLSLKTKWFEMTKAGVKTEDYREINEYWCKRFLIEHKSDPSSSRIEDLIYYINKRDDVSYIRNDFSIKGFRLNIMTLGYPKNNDTDRILKLEHKGIEIRTGNPKWGAEHGKLYFVILHGAIIGNVLGFAFVWVFKARLPHYWQYIVGSS